MLRCYQALWPTPARKAHDPRRGSLARAGPAVVQRSGANDLKVGVKFVLYIPSHLGALLEGDEVASLQSLFAAAVLLQHDLARQDEVLGFHRVGARSDRLPGVEELRRPARVVGHSCPSRSSLLGVSRPSAPW